MDIMEYVKPELVCVAIVLYILGAGLKRSNVKDKFIPGITGLAGVLICSLWVVGTSSFTGPKEIVLCLFTAVTQGVLVAGLSTYVNQLIKQRQKEE